MKSLQNRLHTRRPLRSKLKPWVMGKRPMDGAGRRSSLLTFHLLLSSPPTSTGLYQPAQSVCHSRKESRRCHYQHSCKRRGQMTGGECGEVRSFRGTQNSWREVWRGSIRGTSFSGLDTVSASLECNSTNNLHAKTVMTNHHKLSRKCFHRHDTRIGRLHATLTQTSLCVSIVAKSESVNRNTSRDPS